MNAVTERFGTGRFHRRQTVSQHRVEDVPVGRSKSPGYGHLKLPHLMIAVSAAEQQ
ncbi:CRISPR/Cas system CSM-associated protein Csm3 (group 7 of RAMP superfamily) [Bradyrhizobium japonicum]|nr:CRISPR/Cas system CSM-associated protein Csm3 (group 7 of RAMP superfamily) [Bradyrhizobium japonicum]MCP1963483.1 CRISPR/Cas system CSM-associated protein Csm3 (group 7 of RAMP superfamily) [Bradyrhizobium japonicum]